MRTLKPLRLGLLARPYLYRGQHQLGVAVMAYATMQAAPRLLPEAQLWQALGEYLDEDEAFELGVPKPCAEFLVSGKAYAHGDGERGRCAVEVAVAGQHKHLLVSGARAWVQGRLTEPTPVDGVPVDWRHAYGGPGCDDNPVGLGAAPGDDGLVHAPQVEAFDDRMMHEHDRCAPAGLGPVSPVRPRRFKLSGDYDPAWLEHGFPGFPDTLDPHFFNAAPPDQWLSGMPALPPGAPYRLGNLHPRLALIEGHLPRWRARCFVQRHDGDDLLEIALRHTTVWFFPDQERMLLVYHGALTIDTDDATDLAYVMPALERDEAPRELAHYRGVALRRLPREQGAVHALRDADLVPRELTTELFDPQDSPLASPLALNMQRRASELKRDMLERARAVGQDPDAYPLDGGGGAGAALASLEDLPDYLRQLRRRSREIKAAALRQRREAQARLEDQLRDVPADSPLSAASLMQAAATPPPGGPPVFGGDGAQAMEAMEAMARQAYQRDPKGMSPEQVQDMMQDGQARLLEAYRQSAHHQNAPAPTPAARIGRLRRRVTALMQGSRDLSGLDLTGVDLSGLDLSGARCVGTLMEAADLSGVSLAGADLRGAVLTRAVFFDTRCAGADFSGANLGRAEAFGSDFSQVRCDETVLDEAVFTQCGFERAVVRQLTGAGLRLFDCRFDESSWDAVTLWQGTLLMDCSFARATLARVVWLDASLQSIDYGGARLSACAWVQCRFDTPPVFTRAELRTCAAVQADWDGARFDHALLHECNLRGLSLRGADFSGARLHNSDLSEADLTQALLAGADARGSLLMQADLRGADLRRADFIDALMSKSDFRHADLRGANLFRADISQGQLDDSTRSEGAYVKQAKTLPAAPGAPA